jgi:peptide chain release factor 3
MQDFKDKLVEYLAADGGQNLAYLAPSMINLNLTMERWAGVTFHQIREHGSV